MAQIVALILLAQLGGGATGITSVKVGEFLSMDACKAAAAHAVPIDPLPDAHVGFVCVPLSPVRGAE